MYSVTNLINGTYGKVWEDGNAVLEVTAFQLKVTKTFETKTQGGRIVEDRKLVSVKVTGSMTIDKVYSRSASEVEKTLAGQDVRHTLVGSTADPSAVGSERVMVTGVSYDDLTIMDFAHSKTETATVPFQASDVKFLDKIEVSND